MKPLPPTPLTVKQASAILGYSKDYVYDLIKTRQISFIESGITRRIPVAAIEEFFAKNTIPALDPLSPVARRASRMKAMRQRLPSASQ